MKISINGDKHEGICDHKESCCPHNVTGSIISTSNVFFQGKAIATIGDEVTTDCPHCKGKNGLITQSDSKIYIKGKQAAGIGSIVKYENGEGKIITAGGNING